MLEHVNRLGFDSFSDNKSLFFKFSHTLCDVFVRHSSILHNRLLFDL